MELRLIIKLTNIYFTGHWFTEPFKDTYIYFWNRNKWIKGPTLIEGAIEPWSSAAINATTAMIVYIKRDPNFSLMSSIVYDFELEKWIHYPKIQQVIDYQAQNQIFTFKTSLTVLIYKQNRK